MNYYYFALVIIFSGFFSISVQAASFDCDLAETETEHSICNNPVLNDADVKMAASYRILKRLVSIEMRSIIQHEQMKWLELRDECKDNVECLEHVYKMRQQKLDLYLEPIYKKNKS